VVPRPLPRRAARRGPRPGPRGRLGRVARCDQPALLRPRKETIMNYADYQHLTFERKPHGVLLITINRPEVMNATNERLHWQLTQVWLNVDADRELRVAHVTGAGEGFYAGGGLSLVQELAGNADAAAGTRRGGPAEGAGRGHQARPGQPALDPVDEARPQQLAAAGRADLRPVARARDAHVHAPGRPRGRPRAPREARARVSVRTVGRTPSDDLDPAATARRPPVLHARRDLRPAGRPPTRDARPGRA